MKDKRKEIYTKKELEILDDLIKGACEAERFFTLDELEEYANKKREENGE